MVNNRNDKDRPGSSSSETPISNGPNVRPRDESIGQTADGLPNDSSMAVEVEPEEEKRIAEKLGRL